MIRIRGSKSPGLIEAISLKVQQFRPEGQHPGLKKPRPH